MNEISSAFIEAFLLIWQRSPELTEIVLLSLRVTGQAVIVATLIGVPLGIVLAMYRFCGHSLLTVLLSVGMGLPPVVVGLFLYLLLSKSGLLAPLDLLYTPTAMIIAQIVLITPIIAVLSKATIQNFHDTLAETFATLHMRQWQIILTMAYESRHSLIFAIIAGIGRGFAEVGAVMIVGGNISHLTRLMTTSIVLETSRGDFSLALALGIILILLATILNTALFFISQNSKTLLQ